MTDGVKSGFGRVTSLASTFPNGLEMTPEFDTYVLSMSPRCLSIQVTRKPPGSAAIPNTAGNGTVVVGTFSRVSGDTFQVSASETALTRADSPGGGCEPQPRANPRHIKPNAQFQLA